MAFENSNAAEETMSIFKDDRKGQFKDLAIDHRITGRNWPTALRIREFRRPQGYKKTRAILVIPDLIRDPLQPICNFR